MAEADRRFIDYIMELKLRCRFEEEIGEECGLAPREVSCLSALSPGENISAGGLARAYRLVSFPGQPAHHGTADKGDGRRDLR